MKFFLSVVNNIVIVINHCAPKTFYTHLILFFFQSATDDIKNQFEIDTKKESTREHRNRKRHTYTSEQTKSLTILL